MSAGQEPAAEVRAAEARLAAAMQTSDVAALDLLLHDELVYTDPGGGVGGKQDDLAAHRAGRFRIDALDVRELMVDVATDAVAVTRALVEVSGVPVSATLRYTRCWTREEGRWQVRVAHIGIVAPG